MRKYFSLFALILFQSLEANEFDEFGLYSDKSAKPNGVKPEKTILPLQIAKGSRIAYVGNTQLDRAQHFGHFESFLQRH